MSDADGEDTILVKYHGLAIVRVEGEDATVFLDAQSMAALADVSDEAVQASAFADPKGRVLATCLAWREDDAWRLAVPASEAEWLCAHLARFVFRSRVRIAAAPAISLLGVTGEGANAALAAVGLPAPGQGRRVRAGPLDVIGLAGERLCIVGAETALADAARALASHAEVGEAAVWKRARLLAGEVEIRTETRGRFLPQMLGLVELGAVNFRKGCYPGQEIIARAQNLGRVKRALALFDLDAPLAAGSSHDVEGARLEVLDSVALPAGGALVQAVAPSPLPDALPVHRTDPRQTSTAPD